MIQFIYNSLYSYDNFGIIAKMVGRPLLPAKRKQEIRIPGRNGTYDFGDNTYENVIIPVLIQCIADDFPELRTRARTIAAWLSQDVYKPLVFTDEPDKYYLAKIYDSVSFDKIVELAPGELSTINFECSPLAYSIDEDMWLDQVVKNEAQTIQNGGTYKVVPVIIITPMTVGDDEDIAVEVTGALNPEDGDTITTLTNPALTIGANTLVYTGTVNEGETLRINTDTYQVAKNSTNVLANISGSWPVLAIGDNTISLVDTTSECGGNIQVIFRKRWL